MQAQSVVEERSARSTSPSLLTATVGQRVLSRLDDGSGCTSPERVIGLWTEEGVRNSRDILQVGTDQDQDLVLFIHTSVSEQIRLEQTGWVSDSHKKTDIQKNISDIKVNISPQTLDFPLEERLSLVDLTLALDNELLVSGNGIHQVALISYKNEIQHLQ